MTVVVVGIALTSLFVILNRNDAMRTAGDVMDRRALFVSDAVRVSVRTVMNATSATAGLFASSEEVRQDEFDRFVQGVDHHSGSVGVAFIPQVDAHEWPAFIDEVTQTDPHFRLFRFDRGVPVNIDDRPATWPVVFSVAASAAEPDLRGFDAGSDPVWAELLRRTEREQRTSVSRLTQLFGVPGDWGFVAASPVIEDHIVTGFTVEVVRLSGLVEAELADSLAEVIRWEVRDLTDTTPVGVATPDQLRRTVQLELGGRSWQVDVTPTDEARDTLIGDGAWYQFAIGLLGTFSVALAAHLAVSAARNKREADRLRWITNEKDDFLTALSHELRTPLTVVVGMADILEETTVSSDPEVREYVGLVRQEGHALARLVDDLLLLGRLDAEVLPMRPENVDVRWEAERITNEVITPETVDLRIEGVGSAWADPLRLRHIIRHLYTNALRHGGENVGIQIVQRRREMVLTVSDDGPGVPEENLDRLFTSSRGLKLTPGGPATLGLGLRVSKRLAEAQGGTLSYSRREGLTVFEMRLPVDHQPMSQAPVRAWSPQMTEDRTR